MNEPSREELKQLWQSRQRRPREKTLKADLEQFLKQVVRPRQRRFGQLGQAWTELLPAELVEHSCLDGLRGGTLVVLVDDASHLYELDLLVKEGLLDHLRSACPSVSVSRIKLRRGLWYRLDEEGNRIPEFND